MEFILDEFRNYGGEVEFTWDKYLKHLSIFRNLTHYRFHRRPIDAYGMAPCVMSHVKEEHLKGLVRSLPNDNLSFTIRCPQCNELITHDLNTCTVQVPYSISNCLLKVKLGPTDYLFKRFSNNNYNNSSVRLYYTDKYTGNYTHMGAERVLLSLLKPYIIKYARKLELDIAALNSSPW